MNKKKKFFICGIIALSAILVVFVILFVFGIIKIEKNSEQPNNLTSGLIDEQHLNSDWINYILSQNITSIKIDRERSTSVGDPESYKKSTTVSADDLRDILLRVADYEIHKTYALGLGGIDRDHLTVTYEIKEKQYVFEIYYGSIFVDNCDEDLKTILKNNNYPETNVEFKHYPNSIFCYEILGFFGEEYDIYFQ